MKKHMNFLLTLVLCFGLMFILLFNACNIIDGDDHWDIKDIRIELSQVIETPLEKQQDLDLPNCGGNSPLNRTLAHFASVQHTTTIGEKAVTAAGIEVGIPESVKLNLKHEIEETYQQEYTTQSSTLHEFGMEAAAKSYVVYVAGWLERKYDSVVTFVKKGEVHRISYQYILLVPRLINSYQKDCPDSDAQETCTLTISVVGYGSTNPTVGSHSYSKGEDVHIRANPSEGYSFDHWEGDTSGADPSTTITMDSDKSIISCFAPSKRTLSIHVMGQGTTVPDQGSHTCDDGQRVTISANPSEGYSFDHWSGTDNNNINPITVTMNTDKTVTAYFVSSKRTLTIHVIGQGTTVPDPGSHTCDDGQRVTISANPSEGYSFDRWSGADNNNINPTTVTMNTDKTVTAYFVPIEVGPVLDQSNEPVWSGGWMNINKAGQSFVPQYPVLIAVEVNLLTGNTGRGDDTITMKIISDGLTLYSSSLPVDEGFDGWLRFDIPGGGTTVTVGDSFIIQLEDTGKTVFGWKYAGDTYPFGSRFFFGKYQSGDFFFRTYGKSSG